LDYEPGDPKRTGDGAVLPLGEAYARVCGLSRRTFCAAVGGGLVTLGAAGCLDPSRLSFGGIDDGGGTTPGDDGAASPPEDMAMSSSHDLAGPPRDMATVQDLSQPPADLSQGPSSCPSGLVNAGPASSLAADTARHYTDNFNYDLYLCRDANGVYALSASCTHSGCTVNVKSSGTTSAYFYCPCHGARFNFNGQQPTSPAFSPLQHYAVCIDGSGTAWVDYNTPVSASTRY
jgi:Rieske Fe-S protein